VAELLLEAGVVEALTLVIPATLLSPPDELWQDEYAVWVQEAQRVAAELAAAAAAAKGEKVVLPIAMARMSRRSW
jgi:hypothetical protein